jgi:hypothetical protein
LIADIKRQRLALLGCVVRIDQTEVAKKILEIKPGDIKLERHKFLYLEEVENDLGELYM